MKRNAYFGELGIFEEDVAQGSRNIRESLAGQKEELDWQIKELSRKEEGCRGGVLQDKTTDRGVADGIKNKH